MCDGISTVSSADLKVRRGAKARHADGLALEILDSSYLRGRHDIEGRHINDRPHSHQVAALEARIRDYLTVGGGDMDLARQHRLRHGRGAGDINEIGIHSFLLVETYVLSRPKGKVQGAYRRIADHDLLGIAGCRESQDKDNGKN